MQCFYQSLRTPFIWDVKGVGPTWLAQLGTCVLTNHPQDNITKRLGQFSGLKHIKHIELVVLLDLCCIMMYGVLVYTCQGHTQSALYNVVHRQAAPLYLVLKSNSTQMCSH